MVPESPYQPFSWQELGKIFAGFLCIWVVFDFTAQLTQSTLGEKGIPISVAVIATAFGVEKLMFKQTVLNALRSLGLGSPNLRAMLLALFIGVLLLAFFPAFSLVTGARLTLRDRWLEMSLGLFAQAGVAEEVLFRGYLFGHLRRRQPFWHAALLSLLPFVAVHSLLFLSLDWAIALASMLLALAVTFPFCYLYDLNRRTIWASALLHWIIQGAIKLVITPDGFSLPIALGWMAVCATIPYVVFIFREQ